MCLSDSDWEIAEPQSFSFSRKRQAFCVENQEDMNYDGTAVKAPPASRGKMMPPIPQQSLQSSIEAMQLQMEVEDPGKLQWRNGTRRRTSVDGTRQSSHCENGTVRWKLRSWSFWLGPEDAEVDLRHVFLCARQKKGRKIF